MDHYIDLKALPNPEIMQSAVAAHLMQNVHEILPQYLGRVGISFPNYGLQQTLGGTIRLFAQADDLHDLHSTMQQSNDFRDYSLIGDVSQTPKQVKRHACFSRVQTKGNSRLQRLKKRHQARGTWSAELEQQVTAKYQDNIPLPHVIIHSTSTGQNFPLLIKHEWMSKPSAGNFSTYGLSATSTVPWF